MKSIIVLGAGLVGSAIAMDLSKKYKVTSVDGEPARLNSLSKFGIEGIVADFTDYGKISKLVAPFDLVVGAVPGWCGYKVLQTVIEAGKNVVDISFFPEDSRSLDELAYEKDVAAIVDCGVAPGMSNLIIGYYSSFWDINSVVCMVGGLPYTRHYPFQYRAPFSPVDVIEEYTRPARVKVNGKIITLPALSEPELLNFDGIGTLEAFNSDGLRTLLELFIPTMYEKTLRYPGHRDLILALKESGFFSEKAIDIAGNSIKPLDFTSKILFDNWKLNPGEKEFTVMRIVMKGFDGQINKEITCDLFDKFDEETGVGSMSRTTGYACTSAVSLLLEEGIKFKGIIPPEKLGLFPSYYQYMLKYQEERGIHYEFTEREILA